MQTYSDVREDMATGDVVLVKTRRFVSVLIRMLTGESFNHNGVLVWMDSGLWVAEMREGKGFVMMPASQWFAQIGGKVYWGKTPWRNHPAILPFVLQTREDDPRYGYWTLFRVLWWQLRRNVGVSTEDVPLVCSLFAQGVAAVAEYVIPGLADPGDIADHCLELRPLA